MMPTVATPDDLDDVCSLLWEMHRESGIGKFDKQKTRGVASNIIENGGCLIIRQDDRVIGGAGVYMMEWWYSTDKALIDRWFFIHPQYRDKGHATSLLEMLKLAASTAGVPLVLQVGTTVDTLGKLKFFKKSLRPFGGAFVHIPEAA